MIQPDVFEDRYFHLQMQLRWRGKEFELEEPTGRGRNNVKTPSWELAPLPYRCECIHCHKVEWRFDEWRAECERCEKAMKDRLDSIKRMTR